MGEKPKIGDEMTETLTVKSETPFSAGIELPNFSVQPKVDPKMAEKVAAMIERIRPQVFGSLPASISSFMAAYQKNLQLFATTISDESQRIETAIVVAKNTAPVAANVIQEAEVAYKNALKAAQDNFQQALSNKANNTIGVAKKRSEEINLRLTQIEKEIAALTNEKNSLTQEYEQVRNNSLSAQEDLQFSNDAFNAAYVSVESEVSKLLTDLAKMI